MSFVGDLFGGDSKKESRRAAEVQADYQREALQYLQETEALPRQYREAAMRRLAGAYGLEGGEGSQEQIIEQARRSPLYSAIMSGQQAGEEAILRNQAATGGLRSGNTQMALADYNTRLQNQALLESYNQQMGGLQGMAGYPSNVNQIAAMQQGIGTTLAQGIIGGAQSRQAGIGQGMQTGLGVANLLGQWFNWSDMRLKSNIRLIGDKNGHQWFAWEWNGEAEKLGLFGEGEGVIADLVEEYQPEAVSMKNGYKVVDYQALGVVDG